MISAEAQGGRFPRLIQAAIDAFSLPDLRAKILFTLAILALYRFTAHIPLPGIDSARLDILFDSNQLLGFLDLFSGGALRRMSIVALGVFPYITASIVIQLLTPVVPQLQAVETAAQSLWPECAARLHAPHLGTVPLWDDGGTSRTWSFFDPAPHTP